MEYPARDKEPLAAWPQKGGQTNLGILSRIVLSDAHPNGLGQTASDLRCLAKHRPKPARGRGRDGHATNPRQVGSFSSRRHAGNQGEAAVGPHEGLQRRYAGHGGMAVFRDFVSRAESDHLLPQAMCVLEQQASFELW